MNALVTQAAIVPYSDMREMAKSIAASGLFGMKNENQVLALMAVAQAEGKHPAIVARDFDIIQGRPAKKAEAMLRDFLAAGGKVEWHKMDDTISDATFSHPAGGSVRIAWDMERAKQADLKGKDMYRKYPRQMLRARTVSEGVRAVYPAATSGVYVPEEVREFSTVQTDQKVIEHEGEFVTEQQVADLEALITEVNADRARFLKYIKVASLAQIPAANFATVVSLLESKRARS
jgi:hypothetical protein